MMQKLVGSLVLSVRTTDLQNRASRSMKLITKKATVGRGNGRRYFDMRLDKTKNITLLPRNKRVMVR